MGIIARFRDIMEANFNALLDRAEDPEKMIDKYLMDLEEDSATFAVRIINIPVEQANTTIYARPYCIYENTEGEQIVIYADVVSDTYNADLG